MKLFVGVIIVAIIILAVLLVSNLIFSLDEEKTMDGVNSDTRTPKGFSYAPESENTCMELMDMDFNSEQECLEFTQSLFGEIEGKLDSPKVQELLKNYNP